MSRMVYAESFLRDLSLLDEESEAAVWDKLGLVEEHPGIGSSLARPTLSRRFGSRILKVRAGQYLILYQRVDELDETRVLGLVHQRSVR